MDEQSALSVHHCTNLVLRQQKTQLNKNILILSLNHGILPQYETCPAMSNPDILSSMACITCFGNDFDASCCK